MQIKKKFIFIFLIIFFQLYSKFIHGSKKNKIKKQRGVKSKFFHLKTKLSDNQKSAFLENRQILENSVFSKLVNEIISDDKKTLFNNVFFILPEKIELGSDMILELRDKEKLKNNIKNFEKKKLLYIGNTAIEYDFNDFINIEVIQDFIDKNIINLLILLIIKSYLIMNNIINKFEFKNLELIQEQIKFKVKYSQKSSYDILIKLENNIELYKKILLIAIMNILYEKNSTHQDKFFFKWYKKIIQNNLSENELLKKRFLLELKKIKFINPNIDIDYYEGILYMLVYYINQSGKNNFLKLISDKYFFKFILFNVFFQNSSDEQKKEKLLNEYILSFDNIDEKYFEDKKIAITELSGIVENSYKILSQIFEN